MNASRASVVDVQTEVYDDAQNIGAVNGALPE